MKIFRSSLKETFILFFLLIAVHIFMGLLAELFLGVWPEYISSGSEFLVFLLSAGLANVLVVLYYFKRFPGDRKKVFSGYSCRLKHYLAVVLMVIGLGYVVTRIDVYIGSILNDVFYEEPLLVLANFNFLIGFILVVVLPSVFEEIIFRGIILKKLLTEFSAKFAVVFSALLFGAYHYDLRQAIVVFFLGILLGWLYWKYNSLLLVIFAHGVNNILRLSAIHIIEKWDYPIIDNVAEVQPIGITVLAVVLLLFGIVIISKDSSGSKNLIK